MVIEGTHRDNTEDELEDWAKSEEEEGAFDPSNDKDARDKMFRAIVQRRGQQAFRQSLIKAYKGKCAVTACSLLKVLEAAHIRSYQGKHTNDASNGILLRADLHTLFDLYLIALNEDSFSILIAPELKGTEYERFAGKRIFIPDDMPPNREAVRLHREKAKL